MHTNTIHNYTSLSVWPTRVDYLKCLDLPPLPRQPNQLLLEINPVSPKPLLSVSMCVTPCSHNKAHLAILSPRYNQVVNQIKILSKQDERYNEAQMQTTQPITSSMKDLSSIVWCVYKQRYNNDSTINTM
jgi:hypothetical protein